MCPFAVTNTPVPPARLKEQKKAWQAIARPLPEVEPLYPGASRQKTGPPPLPDESLLEPDEARILSSLTARAPAAAASAAAGRSETSAPASGAGDSDAQPLDRQVRTRLRDLRAALEFAVDRLADSVHKLDVRVATAGREADAVLALGAARLRERELRERRAVGTAELPTLEVLRSLGRILPEGG